jgi:broad specificity phosphatase PhoE
MALNRIVLLRHSESIANVASEKAELLGHDRILSDYRDADVPLSEHGVDQAKALALWWHSGARSPGDSTNFTSPYLRARQTLEIGLSLSEHDELVMIDERLRDRELGILELLTSRGVERLYPGEAARRRHLGPFYYRPPGGESWADIALRVRSFLRDVDTSDREGTLLIACHDAVVSLFLYVCLGMTETELLQFCETHPVLNTSLTELVRSNNGRWQLATFAGVGHLGDLGPTSKLDGAQKRPE